MGKADDPKNSKSAASLSGRFGDLVMLGAAELRAVLTPAVCLKALEDAYGRLHAAPADAGRSIGFQTRDGKFHVKAGLYPGSHTFFAAKINANFPENMARHGRPTIQGLIVLCDGADGHPLAILDSGELTGRRTAAATALATKHGARTESETLAMIGCGVQAPYQLEALQDVLPIRRVAAYDRDLAKTDGFVDWASEKRGLDASCAESIAEAVCDSDVIVTCTSATSPILSADMVPAGSFIAAVGADNPDKQELDPKLFAKARIVVDDLDQCVDGGDLAHTLRGGAVARDDVTATLAQLAAGARQARSRDDQIVVFDSTGTGLQDVAAAAAAYAAVREG